MFKVNEESTAVAEDSVECLAVSGPVVLTLLTLLLFLVFKPLQRAANI